MARISLSSSSSISVAPATAPNGVVQHNMHRGTDLFFYHHPDYCKSLRPRPLKFQDLISNATTSVKIWDPYFNASVDPINPGHDFEFFSYINDNVAVEILTWGAVQKYTPTFWSNLTNTIRSLASGKTGITFKLGFINKSDHESRDWEFHDRFLIIDDAEYAFVGCSLTDHVYQATKSSAIAMIQDPLDQALIDRMYNLYFNHADAKGNVFFTLCF